MPSTAVLGNFSCLTMFAPLPALFSFATQSDHPKDQKATRQKKHRFDNFTLTQGRHPLKKVAYFRALPEWGGGGGGFTDAQIFWPFFYQVKVPKIGTLLLKNNNICMFFGHFFLIIIKITIITIIIIIAIIITIIGTFFLSHA